MNTSVSNGVVSPNLPDAEEMPVIWVDPKIMPKLSRYARHLITHGHEPGVLSGSDVRGRSNRYGRSPSGYAAERSALLFLIEGWYGVRAEDAQTMRGRPRVWHKFGRRVRLMLVDKRSKPH